jgi:hypothetical protein
MQDRIVKTATAKSNVSNESSGTSGVGDTFGIGVSSKFWVAGGQKVYSVFRVTF